MLQLSQPIRDPRSAQQLCRELFQLDVSAAALPGYADANFKVIDSATGDRFVLKLAHPDMDAGMLALESAAMRHLAGAGLSIRTQQPVAAVDDNDIVPIQDADGAVWHARLVTFLDGHLWSDAMPASAERLHALGRALGEMAAALAGLQHPDMHRDVVWDIRNAPAARAHLPLVEDEKLRTALQAIMDHFDAETVGRLEHLPRSLIHNDANDNNLILDADDRLIGILDFGDMAQTWRIADLAVAGSYVCDGWDDPLAGIGHLVAGYHEVNPLQAAEVAVLCDLILMRLAQSLCNSADAKRREPGNDHITISEQIVQRLLWKLLEVPATLAHYRFREACGWEPVAGAAAVRRWLRTNQDHMASVVNQDLRRCRKAVYDFSASAADGSSLQGNQNEETARLFAALTAAGAEVGVGRYRENRSCYQGTQFGHDGEARTVHMGIDLFVPAGEPIYAPLAGTVHSFADNAQPFDYGPAIILRHEPGSGVVFFTLYGHLGRNSLQDMAVGKRIGAGERLGTIGDTPVNGGWIPHLHFQITLDMLGNDGDFPGVCRLSQAAVWESLCPNPNLILGMPESVQARIAWSPRALVNKRRQHMSAAQSTSYRRPLKITGGEGALLIGHDGRRYLDMVNNVSHVGHGHPRVVAAAQQQMARLNTNSRFLHDNLVDYTERLTDTLPPHLSVVFLVNSGSEANDLALRLARAHTGRHDIGIIDHAYHGHLSSLIDISPYKHNGPGGQGTPAFVHTAPFPDPYRGPFKGDESDCGRRYAAQAKAVLKAGHERPGGNGLAGFIAESFSGVGGQVIWPSGYLREVFDYVRELGGVCIADEVQVGFGRAGDAFWAFDTQGATPNIVTLGKPIGNGHPLAAVVTTPEIAASFANGMEYFNTFGGNPVSCAVGLAVLDVVQDERLQDNARDVGAFLQVGLKELQKRHPLIGDVRGRGLFIGAELVRDRDTLEPAADEASMLCEWLRERGVLLSTDGPLHNVLKMKPPIVFSRDNAAQFLEQLDQAFTALDPKRGR